MTGVADIADNRRAPAVSPVDWRAVGAYLALACGLAWIVEGIALARGVRFTSPTPGVTLLLAGIMFTPAVAAFLVRRFITHEGFATAGLRRGPWRPYLVVWIGVPLLIVGVYGLTLLLGLGRFDPTLAQLTARMEELARGQTLPQLPPPAVLSAAIFAQSLTLGVLVTSIFTFGEEFGWTGYLLIRLAGGLDLRRLLGPLACADYRGRLQLPGIPCARPRDDVRAHDRVCAHSDSTSAAVRQRVPHELLPCKHQRPRPGSRPDARSRCLAGPWRDHGCCRHLDVHGRRGVAPRSNARVFGSTHRRCLTAAWGRWCGFARMRAAAPRSSAGCFGACSACFAQCF